MEKYVLGIKSSSGMKYVDIKDKASIKTKELGKYKVFKVEDEKYVEVENVIVLKRANDLEIVLSQNDVITLENFYSYNSEIEFINPDSSKIYVMSNDKTAYPQVDPLTQMVFAKGNTPELINIAKINSSLEKVVVDNIEFAHAQRFADASSKMNNDTKTDAPHHMVEDKPFMSTGMMIGLGAITIGGIALAAGGGGSSSGTGVGSTLKTAFFIDSAVEGIDYYINGSTTPSGVTGTGGSFTYNDGDTITFKVGNITVGSITSGEINSDGNVTIQDLVSTVNNPVLRTDVTNEKVVKIAQFLQTLDSDGINSASSAIKIDLSKVTTVDDISTITANLESGTGTDITTLIFKNIEDEIETPKALQDQNSAIEHLAESFQKIQSLKLGLTDSTKVVIININDTELKTGETATVTFRFDSSFSSTPVADDFDVANGSLGSFTQVGNTKVWTATFTPKTTNITDTTNIISVKSDSTNLAGYKGISDNYSVDTNIPIVNNISIDNLINATENSAGFNLTGTGVVGATVTVSGFSTGNKTATVDNDGNWSIAVVDANLVDNGSNILSVTQTISGVTSNAVVKTITTDLVTPTLQSWSADSATKTITLKYDSSLDSTNKPATTDFSITTGGASNSVSAVSISGNTITLTMTNSFAKGVAVTVGYTDANGDTANSIQDLAGNDASNISISSGLVADGYVSGATIYLKITGSTDNLEQSKFETINGEKLYNTGVKTDAEGNFFLPPSTPKGSIVAIGGYNIDTGVPNTMPLKAPEGSSVINPLTTLVQTIVDNSTTSNTTTEDLKVAIQTAQTAVKDALGITGVSDLTTYNPISNNNVSLQKAAATVATIVTLASVSEDGKTVTESAATTVMSNFVTQITNASNAGDTLKLDDAGTVGSLLSGVKTSTGESLSLVKLSEIADASSALASAETLTAITATQSQFLDKIAPSASTIELTTPTKDITPSIKVNLNVTSTDGTAAVVGDKVALIVDGAELIPVVLDIDDIKAGYVEIDATTLTDGYHTISARIIDQSGNSSLYSEKTVVIDTTAPTTPTVATITADNIINKAEAMKGVAISGTTEAGTTVTVNGNAATVNGTTWTYTLKSSEIINSNGLQIISKDLAGNTKELSPELNIDLVAPTATLAITTTPYTEVIGKDNTININGTITGNFDKNDSVVIYDGTTKLGIATISGSTWSFTTPGLSNATHSLTAKVEDIAGNAGVSSNAFGFTINTAVPSQVIKTITSTKSLTNDLTPDISGILSASLDEGSNVVIYDGTTRLGNANVNGTTWTFTPSTSLSNGTHNLIAVVENSGGVQGVKSFSYSLIIDTIAPTATIMMSDTSLKIGDTSIVTIKFSKAVKDFAIGDLTAENGELTNLKQDTTNPLVYTATFTPTAPIEDTTNVVKLAASTYTDNAGNMGTEALSANYVVDTIASSVSITNTIDQNENITINKAQKDSTNGVSITGTAGANDKVTLTIGTVKKVVTATDKEDGTGVWTYKLTADDYKAIGTGTTIRAIATDVAGNVSSEVYKDITVDTVAPTLTVALADSSDTGVKLDGKGNVLTPTLNVKAEEGSTVTYKVGTEDYKNSLGAMSEGKNLISVKAVDAAGNETIRTINYTLDTTTPTVTVSSDKSALKAGEKANIIFTLSEASNDFTSSDVIVTGGTLSPLVKGANNTYTATFTPDIDTEVLANISINSNSYTDLSANSGTGTIPTNGLIAYYKFDGSLDNYTSALYDDGFAATGNASGTSSSNATYDQNAHMGQALYLNGSSDIQVASLANHLPTGSTARTVSVWINPTSATGYQDIVSWGDATVANGRFSLMIYNGKLAVTTGNPSNDFVSNYVLQNEWQNVAVTYEDNSNTMIFYVNGVMVQSVTHSAINTANKGLVLGSNPAYTTEGVLKQEESYTGKIDNLAIYNRALTADEIKSVYSSSITNITLDTKAPTVVITDDETSIANTSGGDVIYTFTFSEVVTGFTVDDVVVAHGKKGEFTGSGKTYTLVVTPETGFEGDMTVDVAANLAKDLAENNNSVAIQNVQVVDTKAPTATITMSDTALKIGDTSTVTIKFSEAVKSFDKADLTVEFGTISDVTTTDNITWTATFTPTANIENAKNVITLKDSYTDNVGNTGTVASSVNYVIDTVAPTVVITKDKTATLIKGEKLTYTFTFSEDVTGFTADDVTVNATKGTFTKVSSSVYTLEVTPTTLGFEGNLTVSVNPNIATDISGNNNLVSNILNHAVDTLAPTITINAISGEYVNNAEDENVVVVSGTTTGVENGQTLTVTVNSKNYTATVTSNTWTLDVPSADVKALTDGATVTVTATVSDVAGNKSETATQTFKYDITAPGFTSVDTVTVSENTTAVVYKAIATDTDAVSYSLEGTDKALFNINATTGEVTFKTAPNYEDAKDAGANNVYDISVIATDIAGNKSEKAVAITVQNVDVTINDNIATDNIVNISEKSATYITLSGTNEPNATVTVNDKAATVNGTSWTYNLLTSTLTEGANTITVVSGGQTVTKTLTVDTKAPTVTIANDNKDGVVSDVDNVVSYTVTFSEAVKAFTASDLSIADGELVADSIKLADDKKSATFSVTALNDSVADLVVGLKNTVLDIAGNPLTASSSKLTVDTKNPDAPVVKLLTDTGLDSADKITSNGTLSVTAEANAKIEYSLDGETWNTTQPTSKDGDNNIQVRATDTAGNVSAITTFAFTFDKTVSELSPVITKAIDNVPTKEDILTNGTSNDNTLELVGTLTAPLALDEKLTIVEIVGSSKNILGEAIVTTVDGNTTWSYTTSALSNGTHNFVAVVGDKAGNTSTPSSAFVVTIDATVPTAIATITSTSTITSDTTPEIVGTLNKALTQGEVVKVYEGNTYLGNATVNGINWTFTSSALKEASHTFTAVVENSGGNQGTKSNSYTLDIDITAPNAPVITGISPDSNIATDAVTNKNTGTLNGTADANSTVKVYINSNGSTTVTPTFTAIADASGNWSVNYTSLADGKYTAIVTATDSIGNISAVSDTKTLVIDTTSPAALSYTLVNGVVTVTSALENGAKCEYKIGADTTTWTEVNSTFNIGTMGTVTFAIKQTDLAGNVAIKSIKAVNGVVQSEKVLGNSISNFDAQETFFGIDKFDNTEVATFDLTKGATSSATDGTYQGYVYDGSTFVADGLSENFDVVSINAATATTPVKVTVIHGTTTETIEFSDARKVLSMNGVETTGLKQVTATWKVTGQTATVKTATDWWEAGYTINNQEITDLTTLKNALLSTSSYGGDVYINENLNVKLVGTTTSTSGTLVEMVWNGTYNSWTDSTGLKHTYKNFVVGNTITGDWSLADGYLTVTVPNQGITAFKINNGVLESTEIPAVGSTHTETLYYGVPVSTFNSVLEGVIESSSQIDTTPPTATITMSDYSLTAGETAAVTIKFSEKVQNFDNNDLTVAGGTLSTVTSSDGGMTWTAIFTPYQNISTTGTISLNINSYNDLAGNNGLFTKTTYSINTITSNNPISVYDIHSNQPSETISYTISAPAGTEVHLYGKTSNGSFFDIGGAVVPSSGVISTGNFGIPAGSYDIYYKVFDAMNPTTDYIPVGTTVTVTSVAPTVANTNPIVVLDTNSSSTLTAGDKITLAFSEPIISSNLTLDKLSISNGNTFGANAKIELSNYNLVVITLGTGATIKSGDIITVNNSAVVDFAGNMATSNLQFTVPTIANNNSQSSTQLNKSFGAALTVDSSQIFFGIDRIDNTEVATFDLTNPANTSTTDGIYQGYVYNGNTFLPNGSEQFDIVSKTPNEVTVTHGTTTETIVFSDAKEVTSVNGIATPNLKQVTATWTVTGQTATVQTATDWWESGYTMWNGSIGEPIRDLITLKNVLLSTSIYGSDVYINENLKVKLVASTDTNDTTHGTLVAMVWDGTYNTWTDQTGLKHIDKHFVVENTITGDWSLTSGYLTVTVPNQGTTAFKIKTIITQSDVNGNPINSYDQLVSTEIPAVGSTYKETLYYGVPVSMFNSVLEGVIESVPLDQTSPTATITMSDYLLTTGETSTVTITFSEKVQNFAHNNLTVTGGELRDLTTIDNGKTWTAIFTPFANRSEAGSISLNDNYTDLAGNKGTTASVNFEVNTTNIAITMSDYVLTAGETATVTITFNEAVSNFDINDLNVSNGSLTDFRQASALPLVYTAIFTPKAYSLPIDQNVISLNDTYTFQSGKPALTAASANYSISTMDFNAVITNATLDVPFSGANFPSNGIYTSGDLKIDFISNKLYIGDTSFDFVKDTQNNSIMIHLVRNNMNEYIQYKIVSQDETSIILAQTDNNINLEMNAPEATVTLPAIMTFVSQWGHPLPGLGGIKTLYVSDSQSFGDANAPVKFTIDFSNNNAIQGYNILNQPVNFENHHLNLLKILDGKYYVFADMYTNEYYVNTRVNTAVVNTTSNYTLEQYLFMNNEYVWNELGININQNLSSFDYAKVLRDQYGQINGYEESLEGVVVRYSASLKTEIVNNYECRYIEVIKGDNVLKIYKNDINGQTITQLRYIEQFEEIFTGFVENPFSYNYQYNGQSGGFNTNNSQPWTQINNDTMLIAKGQEVNIDLDNYVYDQEGNPITITLMDKNLLPSGLSYNETTHVISGTTTSNGSIQVSINDNQHTTGIMHTINIQPIDNSVLGITKAFGATLTVDSSQIFFGIDRIDNTEVATFNLTNPATSSITDGIYQGYIYNGTTFVADGPTEEFDIVSKTTNGATVTHAGTTETIVFSDAKEVTSVNGVTTTGLKQVTATWTVTGQTATVQTATDWWESGYTIDNNQKITDLNILKNALLSTSSYGGDVYINENLKVKLVGTTSSTSGTLVEMIWDGSYNTWTDSNGLTQTDKHFVVGNIITGDWSLANGYLTVTVPNQGTTAFKIETKNGVQTLMSTEIPAVGSTYTETLYYGVPVSTFNSVLEGIIESTTPPTATITMSDTNLTVGETATVTITFNEAITGFELSDLSAIGGKLSNLVHDTNNQLIYTATYTPGTNTLISGATVTLANTYTDTLGNSGTIATSTPFVINNYEPNATAEIFSITSADALIDSTTNFFSLQYASYGKVPGISSINIGNVVQDLTTEGTYADYVNSGNANVPFIIDTYSGQPDVFDVVSTTPNSATITHGGITETVVFSNAKEVDIINGVVTTGLNQVTSTWTVDNYNLNDLTDWWVSYYTTWDSTANSGQGASVEITDINTFKNSLLSTSINGGNIWINDNLQVKLVGDASSTSGTLVEMIWDGTYNPFSENKNLVQGNSIAGNWTLENNYLTVTATNQGTSIFKVGTINTDEYGDPITPYEHLMQTEIHNHTETLYYGVNLSSFETMMSGLKDGATSPIAVTYSSNELIDFSAALVVGGLSTTATSDTASIDQTTGIASFATDSGTTLADAIADISLSFRKDGVNSLGEFAFFKTAETGSDYMLFISDGQPTSTVNDTIIKLTGIIDIQSIDLINGNLKIVEPTPL